MKIEVKKLLDNLLVLCYNDISTENFKLNEELLLNILRGINMGKKFMASVLTVVSILSSIPSFGAQTADNQTIVEIKDTPQSTDLSDKQIEEFGKLIGKTPEEAKSFLQRHPKVKKALIAICVAIVGLVVIGTVAFGVSAFKKSVREKKEREKKEREREKRREKEEREKKERLERKKKTQEKINEFRKQKESKFLGYNFVKEELQQLGPFCNFYYKKENETILHVQISRTENGVQYYLCITITKNKVETYREVRIISSFDNEREVHVKDRTKTQTIKDKSIDVIIQEQVLQLENDTKTLIEKLYQKN